MRLQLSSDRRPPDVQALLGASPLILAEYQNILFRQTADAPPQGMQVKGARDVVEYLKTEVDLDPLDPDKRLYLAAAYHQLGDWEGAARASTDAIELYAGDAGPARPHQSAAAYFTRGYAYASISRRRRDAGERSHNLSKALADLREAVRLNPGHAPSYFYLGALHRALGQWGEAEASYKEAIGLKPDYSEAYNDLGVLYLDLDNRESALEAFERAVDLDGQNPLYLKNLAGAYMRLGRWRDAQSALQRALASGGQDDATYNDLGIAYLKQQSLTQAEEAFRHSLRINPNSPEPNYNLGWVHYLAGREAEAEQAFVRAQKLAPADPEPRRALRRLRLERLETAVKARAEAMDRTAEVNVDEMVSYVSKGIADAVDIKGSGPHEPLTGDELRKILGTAVERLGEEDRVLFAVRLYERGLLPADEAARLAGRDRAEFMEILSRFGVPALSPEAGEALPRADAAAAAALLQSWFDEDPEEQKETWEYLKGALDEDRLSERKLFHE